MTFFLLACYREQLLVVPVLRLEVRSFVTGARGAPTIFESKEAENCIGSWRCLVGSGSASLVGKGKKCSIGMQVQWIHSIL